MDIFLVSKSEYKEDVISSSYATDIEGITKIIADYRKELFFENVRNVSVDFDNLLVTFEIQFLGDWEKESYHLQKFSPVLTSKEG